MTDDAVHQWRPIETCPMFELVWVAYHGHGSNHIALVTRTGTTGRWGDWDYINSHDGEPKYWAPLVKPPTVPDDIAGPDCGCDGCTEQYATEESP